MVGVGGAIEEAPRTLQQGTRHLYVVMTEVKHQHLKQQQTNGQKSRCDKYVGRVGRLSNQSRYLSLDLNVEQITL